MNLCICAFNVPLAYNDDHPDRPHPVEPEVFDALEKVLDRQFGGYTDLGVRRGCWHGQEEAHVWYSVYCEPERIKSLRDIIREVGRNLGQSQMALETSPASAELIDIEPEFQEEKQEVTRKIQTKRKAKKGTNEGPQALLWPEEAE